MRFRRPATALALLAPMLVPIALALPSSSSSTAEPVAQPLAQPLAQPAVGSEAVAGLRLVAGKPERLLPRTVAGRRAIEVAGARLPRLAAMNGRTTAELRTLLLEDPTLVLTPTGRLAYRDQLSGRSDPSSSPRVASFPTSQTFSLQSRPGSDRTIFLDFDGASGFGSHWKTDTGSVDGYSLDSDPAFSAAEHAVVQEVWLRVAEDYAPFDVNVTTQDPGQAAITRSGSGDQVFGTRAQITGDEEAHADLCGDPGCTGIAYVGVFDEPREHAQLQPAWAFTAHYADASAIAETVSHEVGHNLGLDHDDRSGDGFEGYYGGHANWAPIMGSGSRPVIQWSNGQFTGSLNEEDDLAKIVDTDPSTYEGGLRLVPDEAGASVGQAAPAVPAAGALITHRDDVDVFALGSCSGTVSVTAVTALVSPNLDIELRLLDATGSTLGVDDPASGIGDRVTASGMGAAVTAPAGGPVFARVDGVGNGSPSTGYDDYGSIGAYTLSVSGCSVGPTATPSATVTASPTATPTTTPSSTPTTSPTVTATTTPSPTDSPGPEVTVPQAPTLTSAKPGSRGRPYTVKLAWSAPTDDGGSALDGYVVEATRVHSDGSYGDVRTSSSVSPALLRGEFRIARGSWVFRMIAVNDEGESLPSAYSRVVQAR